MNDYLSTLVLSPTNKYKLAWSLTASLVIYLSLCLDFYILAFKFSPLVIPSINSMQRWGSFVVLGNIVLTMFTAIPKEIQIELDSTDKEDNAAKSNQVR